MLIKKAGLKFSFLILRQLPNPALQGGVKRSRSVSTLSKPRAKALGASNGLILLFVLFSLFSYNLFAADEDFSQKINSLNWVTYSPTNFNPETNKYPSSQSIEKDLSLLLSAGFNGIITYGSWGALADIPKIAKEMGFEGVIMGIWDIFNQEELSNAIVMANYVDAYCVGNEGLSSRYELSDLNSALEYIKTETKKPVTFSEQIDDYANDNLINMGDLVCPNVHPFLHNVKNPKRATEWIKKWYNIIKRKAANLNKPVLFKEVGFPTKGEAACNQNNQKKFFTLLENSGVKFAYFEAFDQDWKNNLPVEPYWGLFDKNRKAKKFIAGK